LKEGVKLPVLETISDKEIAAVEQTMKDYKMPVSDIRKYLYPGIKQDKFEYAKKALQDWISKKRKEMQMKEYSAFLGRAPKFQ